MGATRRTLGIAFFCCRPAAVGCPGLCAQEGKAARPSLRSMAASPTLSMDRRSPLKSGRARGGRAHLRQLVGIAGSQAARKHTSRPSEEPGGASGANTWRCVECHGWDYNGKDDHTAAASGIPGIRGIRRAGRDVNRIMALLRGRAHSYKDDMITTRNCGASRSLSAGPGQCRSSDRPENREPKGDPARGAGCLDHLRCLPRVRRSRT